MDIKWQDRVPDTEVLQRAEMFSIHVLLAKNQARWAGHVRCMEDSQLLKQLNWQMVNDLLAAKKEVQNSLTRLCLLVSISIQIPGRMLQQTTASGAEA